MVKLGLVLANVVSVIALILVVVFPMGDVSEPPVVLFRDQDMQPKVKAQAVSDFFLHEGRPGRAMLTPPAGTIPYGHLEDDEAFYTGKDEDGEFVKTIPAPLDLAFIKRGAERYNIYCAVCHDRRGHGFGPVVKRDVGFSNLPSYHDQATMEKNDGELFDVISNGKGLMSGYADQISAADRWAIVAHIRALQTSQNARLEDLPAAQRTKLGKQ